MAENKTKATKASPAAFLKTVDEKRRKDCRELVALMQDVTGHPPKMWGPGIENKDLMARLGKHKTGKGCLYLNKLDDVDRAVLRKLIAESVAITMKTYSSR